MDTSATSAPNVADIENPNDAAVGNTGSSFSSATGSDPSTGSSGLSSSSQHIPPGDAESSSCMKITHQLRLGLFNAALKGDANGAKSLIGNNHEVLKEPITENNDTVLHVAAGAKQTVFVKDMMRFMTDDDLKLPNKTEDTPFCLAAMAGSMPIVEAMLNKDPSLLTIRGYAGRTPLYLAAMYGQKDMAKYLYEEMNNHSKEDLEEDKKYIFFMSINTTLYDLALELLENHDEENELAMFLYEISGNGESQMPLHRLAETPLHLLGQTSKSDKTALLDQALKLIQLLWEKILERKGPDVSKYFTEDDKDLLFDAARLGNFLFLEKLISLYPDLVLQRDKDHRTIFHIAIMHRHDKLFKLIDNIGFNKQVIAGYTDKDGNTLLHLAATYPAQSPVSKVPGAALEMQRELRIYKDVESLVMPSFRESRNKRRETDEKGETPRELFTRTHAKLVENGEKWMRDTASQCMLVGTIIATVIFSAAFTVPGGNDDKEGIPIHWKRFMFQIFAIADEIALSLSCISIIMFLSILTSRYAETDFYRSLPLKLVGGILSLSMSIAAMMLSFISSFFLAYNHQRSNVIPKVGTILVFMPVFVFVYSQYGLLRDIFTHHVVLFSSLSE